MTYPVRVTGIDLGGSYEFTFRPAAAGLVNVIVIGRYWDGDGTSGNAGDPGDGADHAEATVFKPFTIAVRVDIHRPGESQVAGTGVGRADVVEYGDVGRLALSVTATAGGTDLDADWRVVLTNAPPEVTSPRPITPAAYDVTVEYQVQPGNLGNIDHFVVVMMENRSFDHMLGYLSLTQDSGGRGRTDVDGLTGAEWNLHAGVRYPVHRREAPDGAHTATEFLSDPGHGKADVTQQLAGDDGDDAAAIPPLASNAGFVDNFAAQHERHGDRATVLVGASTSKRVEFGPVRPGSLLITAASHGSTGFPGQPTGDLQLMTPAGVGVATAGLLAGGTGVLTYQVPDPAPDGTWAVVVHNELPAPRGFDVYLEYSGFVSREQPDAVMSYYTGAELPVFDMIADHYTVLDRWFCSVPTETWPNRLYALTGGSGGVMDAPHTSDVEKQLPGYTLRTVFEVLQDNGVEWGVYFSDLPFELVFTRLAQNATYTSRMRAVEEFESLAKDGQLPAFCWIEPNYLDVPDGDQRANDDHPPGDVLRGQNFVARIYRALAGSPAWPRSALIVTYDEHGGLYDHVLPPGNGPAAPPGPKDDNNITAYGPRVPALIVSPWVDPKSVAHDVYDHTSVIATVLNRFCRQPDGSVPDMGQRVAAAADLSAVFAASTPTLQAPEPNESTPSRAALPPANPDAFGPWLRGQLFGF